MKAMTNHQWRLAARPAGDIKDSDFAWKEEAMRSPADGEVVVRTLYLSLDPTNRIWMNAADSYLPAVPLGDVMRGGGIGVVTESRNAGFAEGDLVQGLLGWQEYFIGAPATLSKLPSIPGLPLTAWFGLLGHIGLTAYFGLFDVGKAKPGETVVVSAAAGAVGSLVGQLAKLHGCRAVGIAGSDEKCAWLKELGYDAAINYHTENVAEALKTHCPKGIDVYFDNVGGEILEAALSLLNLRGRVAVCGMISQYNATRPAPGPRNLAILIMKRARIEGFLVSDYYSRAGEAVPKLIGWHQQGKLQYRLDVVEGLENAPQALRRLFDGTNTGKLVLKVSDG
jgi:NADPH-dependent curcumin reductase CurA